MGSSSSSSSSRSQCTLLACSCSVGGESGVGSVYGFWSCFWCSGLWFCFSGVWVARLGWGGFGGGVVRGIRLLMRIGGGAGVVRLGGLLMRIGVVGGLSC